MTAGDWVYRCDYCGDWTPTDQSIIFWRQNDELADGRIVVTPAVFCCDHCGKQATSRAGTGRG